MIDFRMNRSLYCGLWSVEFTCLACPVASQGRRTLRPNFSSLFRRYFKFCSVRGRHFESEGTY